MSETMNILSSYGPLAFGVVVFLIIWKVTVMPIFIQQQGNIEIQHQTALALKETAMLLNRSIDRLNNTIERVEK